MSRVNKAYPHLLGGVSEEPSEKRGAGEHWLQDNFISDPVRGLIRRAGAEMLAAITNAFAYPGVVRADCRTYDFQVGSNYLSLVYDRGGNMAEPVVINKTTGQIVPLTVGSVGALLTGGVTSATAVGRYVVLAGPGLLPTYTTTELYGVESNLRHHIAWIRGGAYSRTYRLALVRGNQKLWCEYTTPSASYPEPLDTSGLNVNDPDYLKQVNDLTNQYNSAVNAWIAAAMAAAQPDAIATTLAEEITNSGFLASGETATAEGPNIYINAPSVEDVEMDDGGDGSLARAVGNTVAAAELLSLFHVPGKIVRVRPNNSTNGRCFYMEAVAKDGSSGSLTEVSWRETAGTRFTPVTLFGILGVNDAGTAAYLETVPATLRGHSADFADLPDYQASNAGDMDSNPPPAFMGTPATMLTTFQDRLVVGCKPAINSSKTSDYFNFFRASVVTISADDPVNFVAIGGEDDIIRYALTYDRNLVTWGTGQYIVDGRKPFAPGTVSSVRMASIKDALVAAPVLGDKFVFYGRERDDGTGSVHHLQPGRIQEAPETFELSRRLRQYIQGAPVEISVGNDPDYLYVRSEGDSTLKIYAYQDAANGERVLSAWSRWTFSGFLEQLIGVSVHKGAVYLLFLREGATGADLYLGRVSQTQGNVPYLDMWTTDSTVNTEFDAARTAAWDAAGNYAGGNATPTAGTLYYGLPFDSIVTLTSPFATDRTGLPVLSGRTVVNSVKVWTENSSGLLHGLRQQGVPDGQGAWLLPTGTMYVPSSAVTSLHYSTAETTQVATNSSAAQASARADMATEIVSNTFGGYDIHNAGTSNRDFLLTADGTTDYTTGRAAADAAYKCLLQNQNATGVSRAGFLILRDFKGVGYSPAGGTPWQSWEYSYGNLCSDTEPDGEATYPHTPGIQTRRGMMVRFGRNWATDNNFMEVLFYGQEYDGTGNNITANADVPASFQTWTGSANIVLPAGSYDTDPLNEDFFGAGLEFVFDATTRRFEVYAINVQTHARIERLFPDQIDSGEVTALNALIDTYLPPSITVRTAGHLRAGATGQRFVTIPYEAEPETGPIWGGSGVAALAMTTKDPGPNDRTISTDLNGVDAAGVSFVNGEYRAYDETPAEDLADIESLPTYEHASASIPVGRETREYKLTLQSYLWAPLTIKAVEWLGQLLYRARRL
jgi:hypothetical protein